MKKSDVDYTLYLCTDRDLMRADTVEDAVRQALLGGVTMVQLREKNCSAKEFFETAQRVKKITDQAGVPLIINDRVDIALAVDADGVHVGQSDIPAAEARRLLGPDKIIGVSARTVEQARKAEADGADYLGVGAMFVTGTKQDAKVTSKEELKRIRAAVAIPIVAIGGIKADNVEELKGTGIDGVAVVSAVIAAENIGISGRRTGRARKGVKRGMKTVLTIAGSDCSGGAGIQADLKTIAAHGLYGMSVITALTAQNTLGVSDVMPVPAAFLKEQLDSVISDIRPDAVKIGMIPDKEQLLVIAAALKEQKITQVVVDPVMAATSGRKLSGDASGDFFLELFAEAALITPNIPEAARLLGEEIRDKKEVEQAGSITCENVPYRSADQRRTRGYRRG